MNDSNVVNAGFGDNSGETGDQETNHEAVTLDRAVESAMPSITEIEEQQAIIDDIMEKAKAKCASHRDTIQASKKHVRDEFNIESKALGTILTKRKQERRMAARIDALEGIAADQFELFEEKMEAA